MLKILRLNSGKPSLLAHQFSRSYYQSVVAEDPYKILGVNRDTPFVQIKEAYLKLSKKYHPDVSKEPNAAEYFKRVNAAYNTLKEKEKGDKSSSGSTDSSYSYSGGAKQYKNTSSSNSGYNFYRDTAQMTEEERLYYKIFGKSFKEDPASFYKPENAHLRRRFEEELNELKRSRGEYTNDEEFRKAKEQYSREYEEFKREHAQYTREEASQKYEQRASYHYQQNYTQAAKFDSDTFLKVFLSVGTLGLIIAYFLHSERKRISEKFESSPKPLNTIELEDLRQKYLQKEKDRKEKKVQDFVDSLAPMKKYPLKNPNAVTMLVDYTIWDDIKLYHVPHTHFYDDENKFKTSNEFEKYPMHNIRVNTMLTLALEAERAMKHVNIKVSDVLKSLKEKGYYEPPGVFFKFYGYMYTKIRRKPIIAENLEEYMKNGEEYIPLFDLFFRYHTPILMANPDYYEIPVEHDGNRFHTTKEGYHWVGNVHINHRPTRRVFVNNGEKNVFAWRGNKVKSEAEMLYIQSWSYHYDINKKIPGL